MAAAKKSHELDEDALRLKVGAVAILLVIAGLAATVLLEGRHYGAGINIEVELGQLGNIVVGTPVHVSGRKIGQVDRVTFASANQRKCKEASEFAEPVGDSPRVLITLWVRASEAHRLRSNSEFFVNQASLLAPQFIEVLPPPRDVAPGEQLKNDAFVCGTTPPRTDRLLTRSLENMKMLRETVRDQGPPFARFALSAYRLYRTIQSLPGDPDQAGRIVANIRRALQEGDALMAAIEEGVDLKTLQKASRRFSTMMARVDGDLGELGRQMSTVQANLAVLSALVAPGRRQALRDAIATFRESIARTRRMARTALEIADAIANAEGTLGLMLADKELFDDFKDMGRLMKERPMGAVGVPPPVVDER